MKSLKKDTLIDALIKANNICRSTHSIVERQGRDTNWEAFKNQLEEQLMLQHRLMYPFSYRKD